MSSSRSKLNRKGWITRRLLGREKLLRCQRCVPLDSLARRGPYQRSSHQINLNLPTPPTPTPSIAGPSPSSSSAVPSLEATSSSLKRKYDSFEAISASLERIKSEAAEAKNLMIVKGRKRASRDVGATSHTEETETNDASEVKKDGRVTLSRGKFEKEKERQKKKTKRQKTEKQVKNEEHRRMLEENARQAEAESSGPRRFLVAMPLASVSDLPGRSVCKHFRKGDLVSNDILPVPLDSLFAFLPAKTVYESLKGPIYFSVSCKQSVDELKGRLKSPIVCSKLLVVSERHFNEVIIPSIPLGERLPRLLGKQTLVAIEQVLEDSQPPHELESSQNSEDKIKYLFKPILRSLGLQNTIITTGFSWREKIGLRSSADLATHNYGPKSDAAIIQVLNKEEAKILILFEAYSRLGQSFNTADENRADRVRLLIQGSYISIRDARPSVVFYLTRDKYMETILIFSEEDNQSKIGYYAEKQPFYNECREVLSTSKSLTLESPDLIDAQGSDLAWNNISLDSVLTSATREKEKLRALVYFKRVAAIRRRLNSPTVCSKLLVVSEKYIREATMPRVSTKGHLPRLLGEHTLSRIENLYVNGIWSKRRRYNQIPL